MQNVSIKGVCEYSDLDRKINLPNGAIIVQKEKDQVIGVYLVVSFRDNKNKYHNDSTASYCSLVNLDNGKFEFEERCSRATSERRVLRHLTHAGYSYPYNPDSNEQDNLFSNMRVQVYRNGNYKINLELGEEYIVGGIR